jgi:two-component system, OmpR family, phosphate regulon sensor histidine kinase PhoR
VPQKPDPRFLAITAHDLRGAVGVLDGAMKELTREVSNDNADAAKLTLMMTRSTQRLLLLGDRLSVLARLMDGSELEIGEPTDLSVLVKEASTRAFSAHARRTLRLRVDAPPNPVLLPLHSQTMAGAISELTVLFCSFSQTELVVRVSSDAAAAQVTFESDNPSESVQRALRDRLSTTQANAGIALAESVLARHSGKLQLSENDGSNAGLSLILQRSQ